jgi:hypothetical protein
MDLRITSGCFFFLLGGILITLGTVAPVAPAPMTNVNVNLYVGAAMVLFGGILVWMAKRHS